MTRGLGLFSGGLDSALAALVLRRQGIEVWGVTFVTPFFGAEKARKASALLDIPIIVRDIGPIHLEMVKNPHYGYGKNMNPCIDCHAMMFRLAGEMMVENGFDFLFSGEVLGQRPMSQNLSALRAVSKASGVADHILRPLSAKLLPITPVEEKGLVDREKLLDIQGRTRRRQEELARDWGITDSASPGGGCLLTEKTFSNRLRDLLDHCQEASVEDVELLKVGRQFRISLRSKLVVGRNKANNDEIKNLVRPDDYLIQASDVPGPLGLLCGQPDEDDIETAAAIVAGYGKGKDKEEIVVSVRSGRNNLILKVAPFTKEKMEELLII
jgi:tRNA U34 2-thiouridine synthase MnmA/TrmU